VERINQQHRNHHPRRRASGWQIGGGEMTIWKTKWYLVDLDSQNVITKQYGYKSLIVALTSKEAQELREKGKKITALSGRHLMDRNGKPWKLEEER